MLWRWSVVPIEESKNSHKLLQYTYIDVCLYMYSCTKYMSCVYIRHTGKFVLIEILVARLFEIILYISALDSQQLVRLGLLR